MRNQTRLVRRGGVFYFRCRVPSDLQDHFGKREIIESLRLSGPENRGEAERLVRRKSVELDKLFAELRAEQRADAPRSSVSDEGLARLAEKLAAEYLQADEHLRVMGSKSFAPAPPAREPGGDAGRA